MKLSKSILKPIRATRNGAAISLSFLRRSNNGGAQSSSSPLFTITAARKKRGGCASENPEPSSPKVTCIGQVRVKSKKKSKQQCRGLSRRRTGGEVSFRKAEQDSLRRRKNHQRWVHLPIYACEALRSFGAEFSSCLLFPCCKNSSCRWLVCAGEGGRKGEIEVVVGGGDAAEEEMMMCVGSLRRHVFEDFEVKNGRIEVKGRSLEVEEEEGSRVSICIPPKNALLIMRCRSDPMKMAALVNRCSWECQNYQDIDEEEENHEDKLVNCGDEEKVQLEINDDDEEGVESKAERNNVVPLPEKEEEEEETEELTSHEEDDDEKGTFQKNQETLLPDSLLLMMCEPKLSMEVSKETWVRSTDFIRWLPDRPRKAVAKAAAGCDHHQVVKRRASVDAKPRPSGIPARPARKNDQPPRSSF